MFDTVGIDVGAESVKLAVVSGGKVKRTAEMFYPEEYFSEGWVTDPVRMGRQLAKTLREEKIRAKKAAFQLPGEVSYVHTASMPIMSEKQLRNNLRYAFTDYITDNLDHYAYDYAMITTPKEMRSALNAQTEEGGDSEDGMDSESGEPGGNVRRMDFLAVAAPLALLAQIRRMLDVCQITLQKAAPPECVCLALFQASQASGGEANREFCVLDLGSRAIRLYIFRGKRHIVTRVLETGMRSLYEPVARHFKLKTEDAPAFYRDNREDCQNIEECVSVYNDIYVELMRTLNFYRFSHQDSALEDAWLVGGGAGSAPLAEAVGRALEMKIHPASELVPGGGRIENCSEFAWAVGAALC